MNENNKNVLDGIQCPQSGCGSLGPFNICGEAQFMGVTDAGCGEFEGMSWNNNSDIECIKCGRCGTVGGFTKLPPLTPVFKVWIQIERVDEDADCDDNRYQNINEPDVLRTFDTLEEAQRFMDAAILGAQAGRGE